MACWLSCLLARGIFLDQGLNLCLLHWQVDSSPLSYEGSPEVSNLNEVHKLKKNMMRLGACQSLSIVFCCCCFLVLSYHLKISFFGLQFSSSAPQSCPTLCDPMDCSMPGLPVHHQLPEFAQTHVHLVSDAIQPSHPLLSPSPALSLSQHQGLFQ